MVFDNRNRIAIENLIRFLWLLFNQWMDLELISFEFLIVVPAVADQVEVYYTLANAIVIHLSKER